MPVTQTEPIDVPSSPSVSDERSMRNAPNAVHTDVQLETTRWMSRQQTRQASSQSQNHSRLKTALLATVNQPA